MLVSLLKRLLSVKVCLLLAKNIIRSTMQDASRIKMGEVFQLHTKEVILACSHCSEEFEYFTEFSLHAQEHLQQLWQQSTVILEDIYENDSLPTEFKPEKSLDRQSFASEEITLKDGELMEITSIDPIDERGAFTEAVPVAETSSIWMKSEIIDDGTGSETSGMEFWPEEPIESEALPHNELLDISTKSENTSNCVVLTSADRYDNLIKEHHTFTIDTHRLLNTFRYKMLPMKVADTPETRMIATFYTKPRKFTNLYVDGKRCMCPICQKPYTIDTFKRHLFTHCKTPPLQCPFCAKTILGPKFLQPHLRTHINYRVECHVCKEPFKDLHTLRSHMRAKHTGRNYCLQCHRQYTGASNFKHHMTSMHSIDVLVRRHYEPDDTSICRRSNFSTEHNETIAPAIAFCPVESIKTEMLPDDQPRVASGHAFEDDGLSTAERYDKLIEEYTASTTNVRSTAMLEKFRFRMMPLKIADTPEIRMLANYYMKPGEYGQRAMCGKRRICPICKGAFVVGAIRNHIFKHCKTPFFQCLCCMKTSHQPILLTNHLRTHFDYRIECFVCKEHFVTHRALRIHMQRKHTRLTHRDSRLVPDSPPYEAERNSDAIDYSIEELPKCTPSSWQCYLCRKNLPSHKRLRSHMETHTLKPMLCPTCGKQFMERANFRTHLNTHNSDRSYACDLCEKAYTSRKYLLEHRKKKHNLYVGGSCRICAASFGRRNDLLEHMRTAHSAEERQCRCSFCDMVLPSPAQLRTHMESHSAEELDCPICGKHLRKGSYGTHLRDQHTHKKTFKCRICAKIFKSKHNFNVHIVNIHDRTNRPEIKCDICYKQFASQKSYQEHRRMHPIPMPFHCKHCNLGFLMASSRRRHEKNHERDNRMMRSKC